MWHRNEAQPTRYGDTVFRSALEAKVAQQLDNLTVTWQYELPVEGITGYLPDFTITAAPQRLELPQWVEVKPAELLYAIRDWLGHPERFEGNQVAMVSAQNLRDAQLTEVWKPKRLAEVTGKAALVVSAINRNRTLSVLMRPDRIELSRTHPAVNYRQLVANQEREQRHAQWQAEWKQRQAQREEQDREQQRQLADYARTHGRPARFDGWCQVCKTSQSAAALLVFQSADGRWAAVCRAHAGPSGP